MKAAMTLDGQLAAADGTSQWISSPEARQDAHRLRAKVDAVMVGAGTLRSDDPRLTVRLERIGGQDWTQPAPVVVAGSQPLPVDAQLFQRDPIVLAPAPLDAPGQVIVVPDRSGKWVDLRAGLARLNGLGIDQLMVEGGSRLLGSLLRAGLIDRAVIYYGPLLAGGTGAPLFRATWRTLADASRVRIRSTRRLGESIRLDLKLIL